MTRPTSALAVLGATCVAALAAAPALAGTAHTSAAKPQKKTVGVFDNYFGPTKLTVTRNSTITWKWDETAADVHDVKTIKAPKGFKKFVSEPGAAGYTYKKKLTKPGKYTFLCTFHENDGMKMTVTVRK